MGRQLLIIIIGFFRWVVNGFKNSLEEEIWGNNKYEADISMQNLLIGLIVVIVIILAIIIF